jgi:hypothetical protein
MISFYAYPLPRCLRSPGLHLHSVSSLFGQWSFIISPPATLAISQIDMRCVHESRRHSEGGGQLAVRIRVGVHTSWSVLLLVMNWSMPSFSSSLSSQHMCLCCSAYWSRPKNLGEGIVLGVTDERDGLSCTNHKSTFPAVPGFR